VDVEKTVEISARLCCIMGILEEERMEEERMEEGRIEEERMEEERVEEVEWLEKL
jgi:hypothetical protein